MGQTKTKELAVTILITSQNEREPGQLCVQFLSWTFFIPTFLVFKMLVSI
jgi:hypothetical protein